MNKRMYALGRLKAGVMNKTETAYCKHLENLKQLGEIQEYWFESLKLKIADNACWYCPDFMVLTKEGLLELHEVKGSPRIFTDDGKVKVKVTGTQYPFKMIVAYPKAKKDGGGWNLTEF